MHKNLGLLVTSGAPFGEKRRRELQALERKPEQVFEILGSTETGGLGYRSLLSADDHFCCLPSVRILDDSDQQWVESPYLQPETRLPLADRLEMTTPGFFRHLGRSDRIFKYAGQRYALAEVEKSLSRVFDAVETFACFRPDDNVAQGGWLEAWIEREPSPIDVDIRRAYQQHTRAPFPHKLHFLPQFPRDAQGKLQILVRT
jgi:hypothetical protein